MKIQSRTQYSRKLYDAVARLLPQLDADVTAPTEEYLKEILGSESITFFIAEEEDVIAGILTLVYYPNITGKKFWIEDVVVDGRYRGKGIGEDLIKAAVEHAKSKGAEVVKLTSRPFRIAANKLYRKIGFEQYDTNVYKYEIHS